MDEETNIQDLAETIGSDLFGESKIESKIETELKADSASSVEKASSVNTPERLEPPQTWRKEVLENWDKLPRAVQEEVLKREGDIFEGIEKYKSKAEVADRYQGLMKPYEAMFQQYNIDPVHRVDQLMRTDYLLAFGTPEQKTQLAQRLLAEYGINLGGSSVNSVPTETTYIDPQVDALQKELNGLKSQLNGFSQTQIETQKAGIQAQVEAFASDPVNEFFTEVAPQITALITSGQAKDLKSAYEQAVWLNPVTRDKLVQKQLTEKAEAERKAAEEKAAAALKAKSVNVRSSVKSSSGTTPTGNIDDTIAETLANIRARS